MLDIDGCPPASTYPGDELIRVDFECGGCSNIWTEVVPRSRLGRVPCPECKAGIGVPTDVRAPSIDNEHTHGLVDVTSRDGFGCLVFVVAGVLLWGFISIVSWVTK